jgi:hypothetical protein
MKKILTLVALCFVFSQSIYASDKREIVALHPFSGDPTAAAILQSRISNELLRLNRVVLVDKKSEVAEADLVKQGTETFMHANTLGEFGRQMGAAFVLSGKVTQFNVEDRSVTNSKSGKTQESWRVQISIDLIAVDVVTGRILASNTFSFSKTGKPRDKLIEEGYKNIVNRTIPFLKNGFPIRGSIVSTALDNKGFIKDMVINAGSMNGVSKGTTFDVFEKVYIVDGGDEKVMENFVGRIRVKETRGADFSTAVVASHKEAMQKIAFDPSQFIIKTTAERVR